MTQINGLNQAFHARSIAIVGVKRTDGKSPPGYTGQMFIKFLREGKFDGRIYPVNPKADIISGLKAYPSVSAIPEHVDYVIITVPAAAVPSVLEDCATAGAMDVHICTAGFAETGEEEGKKLESQVREISLREGLRTVGPNCLGYHVPASRMRIYVEADMTPGPVAFVSQSGGHCQVFTGKGISHGITFSKVISYGNALIMDSTDYLEYLASDPETKIICMYIEDVKDGRKLKDQVTRLVPEKPVVIWKGGLSDSGARAAATHTGSMAGDKQVWDSFFKQTGAIRVDSIDEMANITMTLLNLKPSSGERVAVLGGGGGNTVTAADVCAREGLEVPAISDTTMAKLMEFMTPVNQILVNPIDAGSALRDPDILRQTLETVASDPNIDIILLHSPSGAVKWFGAEYFTRFTQALLNFNRESPSGKQAVMAIREEGKLSDIEEIVEYLRKAGVVTYSSFPSACLVLALRASAQPSRKHD